MFSRTDGIDPLKFKERQDANEAFVFMKSRFNFVNDHKGFRPGCVHVLLSTTGGGKSTLAMTLLEEMLNEKKKIFLYSTEETVADIETKMSYFKTTSNEGLLRVYHESMLLEILARCHEDVQGFLYEIERAILETHPDVFIFDNITTSAFYDQNKMANHVAMGIKRLSELYKIPFIIIAHTNSAITQSEFFDGSKIRGFRSIVNTAQYVYCLMRFKLNEGGFDREVCVIYTDKSRNHPQASRVFYRIFYDGQTRLFTSDQKIKYDEFRDFLKG